MGPQAARRECEPALAPLDLSTKHEQCNSASPSQTTRSTTSRGKDGHGGEIGGCFDVAARAVRPNASATVPARGREAAVRVAIGVAMAACQASPRSPASTVLPTSSGTVGAADTRLSICRQCGLQHRIARSLRKFCAFSCPLLCSVVPYATGITRNLLIK
jgi:hypothetical protein